LGRDRAFRQAAIAFGVVNAILLATTIAMMLTVASGEISRVDLLRHPAGAGFRPYAP
jgi:hypothetical protein